MISTWQILTVTAQANAVPPMTVRSAALVRVRTSIPTAPKGWVNTLGFPFNKVRTFPTGGWRCNDRCSLRGEGIVICSTPSKYVDVVAARQPLLRSLCLAFVSPV